MPHIPINGHARLFTKPKFHSNDTAAQIREWSSVIGIVTAIVGNILISFALNIQRYAHIRLGEEQEKDESSIAHRQNGLKSYGTQNKIAEERVKANLEGVDEDGENTGGKDDGHSLHSQDSRSSTIKPTKSNEEQPQRKNYLRSPYWWVGIVLMTIGEAGNFLAYGFAPASIVSPLGVVALVSNCIIAPFLLKERFRRRDFLGVLIAIAGAVVVVLSAKNSETKMGPSEISKAITRWEFLLYLGITALVILVLMWASGRYGERTILIDLGLVGLFGGYTALSTKGVASLLSYTLWRALTFPITYLLLAVLVLSAVAQIRYVNRALQRFDSTQVIPTQFVLFTISVILGSAILYRDFESATADRVGKFIGGCLLTFIGVYSITSGRAGEEDDRGADEGQEDERIALIDEEQSQNDLTNRYADGSSSPVSKSRRPSQQQPGSIPNSLPQTPVRQLSRHPSAAMSSTSQSSFSTPTRPPPLESTVSTPLLNISSSQLNLQSSRPSARQQQTDRPPAVTTASMARLMPGPLSSPLSSPLRAIVADSLRRGVDTTAIRSRQDARSLRLTRSQSRQSTGEIDGGESGFEGLRNGSRGEDSSDDPAVRERNTARRLSSTLGDFFRLKRERSRRSDGESAEDHG